MKTEKILNKLDESWNNLESLVIFGYSRVAERNINKLRHDFSVVYAIDSNRQCDVVDGIEIKKIEVDNLFQYKIIVTTASISYDSIKKILIERGLKEYHDFCRLEVFFIEWYWKNKNEICVSQMYSSVTTKCTFRCEDCTALVPYIQEHMTYTPGQILRDLNSLFLYVDYLSSY